MVSVYRLGPLVDDNREPPTRGHVVALLSGYSLLQVYDPVRELLIGDGLDRRDKRTDAGWAA